MISPHPHAIPQLQIMPNPMPAPESELVLVPTLPYFLPPFAPDSDSPETRVKGYNPKEHGKMSHKELIDLFGEENMSYCFKLRVS
jgi:hypothetical protein